MNPDASVLALASAEFDLSGIPVGQEITVKWRGKPIFIRHRTEEEIAAADAVDVASLPHPETDDERVRTGPGGELERQWLVVIGICTDLGCVPLSYRGEYDGYFCSCHGSVYDTSGRIRKGPAPTNLDLPPYELLSDTRTKIGLRRCQTSGDTNYTAGTAFTRLPVLRLVNDSFVDYPTPKNLNYWWTFGGILSFCLAVQIVTGIVLAMHYVPTTELAFASVEKIMRDVNYGWLIRYVHANGASM